MAALAALSSLQMPNEGADPCGRATILFSLYYIVIGFEKPFFLENLIKYVCMYMYFTSRSSVLVTTSSVAAK